MWLLKEQKAVEREIVRNGSTYTVKRNKVDKYGEPTQEVEEVTTLRGLFHISKGFIIKNTSDGSQTKTKGQPMFLALWEECKTIQNGDFVVINGNTYKITDKNNIEEYNIIADISLEVVLSDRN
jgi:hypothetical protein|nr:MAG TPA: protein of unknown function (DUF3599) [Caudoviricetes sp.]